MGYREIPEDRVLKFDATPGFKKWESFFTPDSTTHPAKMNLRLLSWILETYTKPGETIIVTEELLLKWDKIVEWCECEKD